MLATNPENTASSCNFSCYGVSGWHGVCSAYHHGVREIAMSFNARGAGFPLKACHVVQKATIPNAGTFVGHDSAGRKVTLIRMGDFFMPSDDGTWIRAELL